MAAAKPKTPRRRAPRKPTAPEPETVLTAVERDLAEIARRSPELAGSAVAASARVLAGELDNSENSATSKSMCARALREAMDRLLELAPAREDDDNLDRLKVQREKRLRRSASA